jgi:hypothetical protein
LRILAALTHLTVECAPLLSSALALLLLVLAIIVFTVSTMFWAGFGCFYRLWDAVLSLILTRISQALVPVVLVSWGAEEVLLAGELALGLPPLAVTAV